MNLLEKMYMQGNEGKNIHWTWLMKGRKKGSWPVVAEEGENDFACLID